MRGPVHVAIALLVSSIFSGCSAPPKPESTRYGADLVITQTADRTSVGVGEMITFTITVTNLGPNSASEIVFGSNSPVALDYVSLSCGAATVTSHSFCELDHLQSGKSVVAHIVARPVGNSTTKELSLNSKAFIAEYIAFDPNRDNNSASIEVRLLPKTLGKIP